jgi:phosphopantetheine adenylyltransferase
LFPFISLNKKVLRRAFSMFDSSKSGKIEKEKVRTILNTLGHTYDDSELDALLAAEDTEGNTRVHSLSRPAINHGNILCVFILQDLNGFTLLIISRMVLAHTFRN